jgi:hypothetical protein
MRRTGVLDGGGTLAADEAGNVYVAWHGHELSQTPRSEQTRRMWIARSRDEGKSFAPEVKAFDRPTGACACCGTRAFTDRGGLVYLLYRSASTSTDRDIYLLLSRDRGQSFQGRLLHPWKVPG